MVLRYILQAGRTSVLSKANLSNAGCSENCLVLEDSPQFPPHLGTSEIENDSSKDLNLLLEGTVPDLLTKTICLDAFFHKLTLGPMIVEALKGRSTSMFYGRSVLKIVCSIDIQARDVFKSERHKNSS
jgi:hypothetical protein